MPVHTVSLVPREKTETFGKKGQGRKKKNKVHNSYKFFKHYMPVHTVSLVPREKTETFATDKKGQGRQEEGMNIQAL